MSEIPYTNLTGKIKEYFDKFQEVRVPEKVNREWLNSIGFSSGNDYYIVKVLKYIKFIDDSNVPTDLWRKYKDPTSSGAMLAQGIRGGYAELFRTYEDAYRKDREAVYAFFSSKTGKAKRTVDYMVSTFTNLCGIADFEAEAPKIELGLPMPESPQKAKRRSKEKGVISEMHINIQLHLPATDDSTIYDNLFKSLKKHLLSDEQPDA